MRVEARAGHLTSDAGVIALREVFERLGLSQYLTDHLADTRKPELTTYSLPELVRTVVLLLALGYRDLDDADALREEPALRLAVSDRKGIAPLVTPQRPEGAEPPRNPPEPEHLASQPTLSRLTDALSTKHERDGLRGAIFECAARRLEAPRGHRRRRMTLDFDSLPIPVHGHQAESAYNGHYHDTIYHPLVASIGETGDLLDVDLRRGNAHTADGALEFILPVVERAERRLCQVAAVRIDAGIPSENVLGPLEARRTPYLSRVRNNSVLDKMATPYLHRPPGRRPAEPRTWFHEFQYQAKCWSRPRRVVLVVLEREESCSCTTSG